MKFEPNTIYNVDCIEGMRKLVPDNSINLVITSPPYNVGIEYDAWTDELDWSEYVTFATDWLSEVYRVLKPDGRIALNILYEVNMMTHGGRVFVASEYWQLMKEIGFKFAGIVDLVEDCPHRVKYTAFGSWLRPSAPYIYNPKECIIIAYKERWKRDTKGASYFKETPSHKKEFLELTSGMWKYQAETRGLTKANFSVDLPLKALKILSFQDDLVLDPFMGSGTTAEACIRLKRKYIGFEISKTYCEIANERVFQGRLTEDNSQLIGDENEIHY